MVNTLIFAAYVFMALGGLWCVIYGVVNLIAPHLTHNPAAYRTLADEIRDRESVNGGW